MAPHNVFDQTALARFGAVGGEKATGERQFHAQCVCTVYFTGDEMSTMVYINLQNNIGKYSLTI